MGENTQRLLKVIGIALAWLILVTLVVKLLGCND